MFRLPAVGARERTLSLTKMFHLKSALPFLGSTQRALPWLETSQPKRRALQACAYTAEQPSHMNI